MNPLTWIPQQCQDDPCSFAKAAERTGVHEGKCPDCGATEPPKPRDARLDAPPVQRSTRTEHTSAAITRARGGKDD